MSEERSGHDHVWREMLNGGSWPWSCLVCGARCHLDGRITTPQADPREATR